MADWRDGPEYAPHERPDSFVAPSTVPLAERDVPRPAAEAEPPASLPDFGAPADAVPLDSVQPRQDRTGRDPHEPFEVVVTALTTAPVAPLPPAPTQPLQLATAPAAGPQPTVPVPQAPWAPAQPMALPARQPLHLPPSAPPYPAPQVNPRGFPAPDADRWYAPYGQPPAPRPRQVTAKALWEAATPGVLICLVVGGIIAGFSVALLFVAQVLSRRTRYRRGMVRNAFGIAIAVTAALATLATLGDYAGFDLSGFWDYWNGLSTSACWLLIPVIMLIQGGAIRQGEPREPD